MALSMARLGAGPVLQNRNVARSFTATRHTVRSAAKLQVMAAQVTLKMPGGETKTLEVGRTAWKAARSGTICCDAAS